MSAGKNPPTKEELDRLQQYAEHALVSAEMYRGGTAVHAVLVEAELMLRVIAAARKVSEP